MDKSKISVKVAGTEADIVSFEDRKISVRVPATQPIADGLFLGGNGIFYERYDYNRLSLNLG